MGATARRCTWSPSPTVRSSGHAGCCSAPSGRHSAGWLWHLSGAAGASGRGCSTKPRPRRGRAALTGSPWRRRPAPSACTNAPATGRAAIASWTPGSSTCRWRSRLPEVRVDPLTGLKAIVAADRATRPGAGLTTTPPEPIDLEQDPFAEGHEDRTPPEVYAVRADGTAPNTPGWTVRVVPNLYPALEPTSPDPPPEANRDLFNATPARGAHEVVINAPDPVSSLADLEFTQVAAA